jgi:hypothetical protein
MAKGPWEERVGKLIDPLRVSDFVYSFKPPDSRHGGQPRIDWHACDIVGRYWLIEVKQVSTENLNVWGEVTAGQRMALNMLAESAFGVPLLCVGRDATLYVFHWRQILCLIKHDATMRSKLPFSQAMLSYQWTGLTAWATIRLMDDVVKTPASAPANGTPSRPSPKPALSL